MMEADLCIDRFKKAILSVIKLLIEKDFRLRDNKRQKHKNRGGRLKKLYKIFLGAVELQFRHLPLNSVHIFRYQGNLLDSLGIGWCLELDCFGVTVEVPRSR